MPVFSTSFLPPISYFYFFLNNENIYIDIHENYVKQTYRNRCIIKAANGLMPLSVPVIKTFGNHTQIKDIQIDYSQPWQRKHIRDHHFYDQ